MDDRRLFAAAAARNREPLADVLGRLLAPDARVLEIASGSGEHATDFARRFPLSSWHPSDPDARARESVAAWIAHLGSTNVAPPIDLDTRTLPWPTAGQVFDAVLCINMLHVSPWSSCIGLLDGAAGCLRDHGRLLLYGPFRRNGRHTAVSNRAFDQSLRSRDPEWGVRDLDAIREAATERGFALEEIVEMPANNLTVSFLLSL